LEEKWGSDRLNSYELEFNDCLNNLEVLDLNLSGCCYTWNNKCEGPNFVARKLDRVLVNEEWLRKFGKTCVDFPPGGILDHSPAVISVGPLISFGPKPFKFYNYWLDHKDYSNWLLTCWNQEFQGVPMYKLCRKLKDFKSILKGKNRSYYGDIRSRVLQAKACLDMAQRAVLDSHGSVASLLQERECLHHYVSISWVEEAFLKQKARNQWFQLGDQNNTFFHRLLKGRHERNTITYFCDENGNRFEEINQIKC
jgi:hypothetical protein